MSLCIARQIAFLHLATAILILVYVDIKIRNQGSHKRVVYSIRVDNNPYSIIS